MSWVKFKVWWVKSTTLRLVLGYQCVCLVNDFEACAWVSVRVFTGNKRYKHNVSLYSNTM